MICEPGTHTSTGALFKTTITLQFKRQFVGSFEQTAKHGLRTSRKLIRPQDIPPGKG